MTTINSVIKEFYKLHESTALKPVENAQDLLIIRILLSDAVASDYLNLKSMMESKGLELFPSNYAGVVYKCYAYNSSKEEVRDDILDMARSTAKKGMLTIFERKGDFCQEIQF